MSNLPANHPFSIASLTACEKKKTEEIIQPQTTVSGFLPTGDKEFYTSSPLPIVTKQDIDVSRSSMKSPHFSTGSADCSPDTSFCSNVTDSHTLFHDDRSETKSSRASSPAASEDSGRGSPPALVISPVDPACLPADVSDKPAHSYIALISMAILASPERKLVLSDIYQYIMDNFAYYNNQERAWRNSIRHNLSLNECFIKAGRADNGKGNFWAIHPACVEDFSKGDFRRRQARRRARATVAAADQMAAYALRCGSYSPMMPSPVSALHPYLGSPIPNLPYFHATYSPLYANSDLQHTMTTGSPNPPPATSAHNQFHMATKIPPYHSNHLMTPPYLAMAPGGRPLLTPGAMRNSSLLGLHHGPVSSLSQESPSVRYSPYARPPSHLPSYW